MKCPVCNGKKGMHFVQKCGDGRGFSVKCSLCAGTGRVNFATWWYWRRYAREARKRDGDGVRR